ncbi:hypothetical protein BGW42_003905 [Actinomortierella wolfii]|nr:hypothetical protein BGW42_003905 [Actinomortierella wolfii]
MEHIERELLYTDAVYRFKYVASFMNFGQDDIDAIHAVAPGIKPLVPAVVDAVYNKLHSYDITWAFMAKRHEGFSPKSKVIENVQQLDINAEQIKFRKDMLSKYLARLVENPYDEKMIKYLEYVAKIHTDTPGKKSKINVDLIHCNALLGYVETVLMGGVNSLTDVDQETKNKAIAAFGKLLWIQMDFFIKYYCPEGAEYRENKEQAIVPAQGSWWSRLLRWFM